MFLDLCVYLLGGFRLAYGDKPVAPVDTARLRSLLAYLVLRADAPQSREHLAFLFKRGRTCGNYFTNCAAPFPTPTVFSARTCARCSGGPMRRMGWT
jgi:hypothetical protein